MVDARFEHSNGQRLMQSLVKMHQKSKPKLRSNYVTLTCNGCHFQQSLPWPNDPNWHGQYFQGRFLYKLDHVSISYHHFHYWFGHMIIPIIGWFCSWSLLFWGLKFHSSFSSFILLFRALAWSHFLDYWRFAPFSTFHLDTFSNILLNAM